MEQFAQYGVAGAVIIVVFAFLKYLREAREERMQLLANRELRCQEHHDQIVAFTRALENHMDHSTRATEELTKAVKALSDSAHLVRQPKKKT